MSHARPSQGARERTRRSTNIRSHYGLALAVGSFVVLGIAALILFRREDAGRSPASSPLPPGARAFDTLDVQRRGTHTRLRNQGGRFSVITPVSYPADEGAAKSAFDSLADLDFLAAVTDRPARFGELEVDEAKGVLVSVQEGDRVLFVVVIGKAASTGTATFVRVPGSGGGGGGGGEVWLVGGDLHAIFDRSATDWRDRSVTTFAARDAREIQIAARDGAHITLRTDPDANSDADAGVGAAAAAGGARGTWQVVESSVKIPALDSTVPGEIVRAMSSLKASDFADGATLVAAGLAPPALVVTVTLRAGTKVGLLVGNPTGVDDTFIKTTSGPQIFLVKRFNVDRLNRRPLQFREKVLCNIPDNEIVEIAVRNGKNSYAIVKEGQGWKAARPASMDVDSEKVAPFASIFRDWRAPRIAENPPADAVDKPWSEIVGRSKTRSCSIQVGIETGEAPGDPAYFVSVPGSRDIFVVPKWMIDRVVVKLSDIGRL